LRAGEWNRCQNHPLGRGDLAIDVWHLFGGLLAILMTGLTCFQTGPGREPWWSVNPLAPVGAPVITYCICMRGTE